MSVSFFLLLLFSPRSCAIFLADLLGASLVYRDPDAVGGVSTIRKRLLFEAEAAKGGGGGELERTLPCETKKLVSASDGFKHGCGNRLSSFDLAEALQFRCRETCNRSEAQFGW